MSAFYDIPMRKHITLGLALAMSAGAILPAVAYTGQQLASHAKVTIVSARRIALAAFPGKIVSEELETEKGGSGLRFTFDIVRGSTTHEVGVDARTGKVIENAAEKGGD